MPYYIQSKPSQLEGDKFDEPSSLPVKQSSIPEDRMTRAKAIWNLEKLKLKLSLEADDGETGSKAQHTYFTIPLESITPTGYEELFSDIGIIGAKLTHHATLIELFQRSKERTKGRIPRVDLPLQINKTDWRVLAKMAPVFKFAEEELRRAKLPDSVLRTMKRLLTVFEKGSFDWLFSADSCRRIHQVFDIVHTKLFKTDFRTFVDNVDSKFSTRNAIEMFQLLRDEREEEQEQEREGIVELDLQFDN